MNTAKGADLLTALGNIQRGEIGDIWNLLPDIASGLNWKAEIEDTASSAKDYIELNEEYDLEDLRDYGMEYADRIVEDTYKNIHDRVHDLSLWASPEIDEEVASLFTDNMYAVSMTKLESLYLYTAFRMIWDAVIDEAFKNSNQEQN